MLTIFRRHSRNCPHADKGRAHRNCRCPIHVQGTLEGEPIRESLNTRVWARAQSIVREWESNGKRSEMHVTIEDACKSFLDDCTARGLSASTVKWYSKLLTKLQRFCELRGIQSPHQINLGHLSEFRSTWGHTNWAALKRWEQIRTLFKFWLARKWIAEDISRDLKRPLAKQVPTMPFTHEEVSAILSAIEQYPRDHTDKMNRERIRAFVLTLLYTGLRFSDVWSLHVNRIKDGKLMLYTAKTGVPVWLPLPERLLTALSSITPNGKGYYFWGGTSTPHAAFSSWNRRVVRLFRLARVNDAHAHRFRDTFAVEMLLAGVPLERVSVMLGHQSVRVTEKHYSPWVRSRQIQLEDDVRRAWSQLGSVYSLSSV